MYISQIKTANFKKKKKDFKGADKTKKIIGVDY